MLHLLEILDVENVLVVVSRWFGGIQLGADRFKVRLKNTFFIEVKPFENR